MVPLSLMALHPSSSAELLVVRRNPCLEAPVSLSGLEARRDPAISSRGALEPIALLARLYSTLVPFHPWTGS